MLKMVVSPVFEPIKFLKLRNVSDINVK